MIVRENVTINGNEFVKTCSDEGFYIERDGVQYCEAIDPAKFADDRIYTETDVKIVTNEFSQVTEQDYQNALTEMGVELDG